MFLLTKVLPTCSGKPSDQEDYQADDSVDSAVVVGAITGGSIFLLLCAAFIAILLCRKRSKKPKEKPVEEVDENPVYDMYYFADGDRIDYGNVEVEDENQMYGT